VKNYSVDEKFKPNKSALAQWPSLEISDTLYLIEERETYSIFKVVRSDNSMRHKQWILHNSDFEPMEVPSLDELM
jgi:hypothetical protein